MMASEKGHTDIVRILLEANANVDIQNTFALVKDNTCINKRTEECIDKGNAV